MQYRTTARTGERIHVRVIVPGRGSANRTASMAGRAVSPQQSSFSLLLLAALVLAVAVAAFALLPAVRSVVAGLRGGSADGDY